jgi:hypothetical protein
MELIVARYNENIDWIKENNLNSITSLYCKGRTDDVDVGIYKKVKYLPNVGREGHTYFHHIIENYDNLSDLNIFVQANPFDHCSGALDFINNLNIETKELYYKSFPTFTWPIINYDCNLKIPEYTQKICNTLFDKHPHTFDAWCCGMFVVSKNMIRFRSKKFYEKCIEYLNWSNNPIEGHIFERLWTLIFDQSIQSNSLYS